MVVRGVYGFALVRGMMLDDGVALLVQGHCVVTTQLEVLYLHECV